MGRLSLQRQDTLGTYALIVPMLALFVIFFAGPLLLLVVASLLDESFEGPWRASNWVSFLSDPYNVAAIGRSLRLGLIVVCTTLAFAYPLALVSRFGPRWAERFILLAALLPFLTSVVVRSFAWIAILSRDGPLNGLLMGLGVIDEPLRLLPSELGVVMALTQIEMPLMLLPLLVAMRRIDDRLGDASQALGASAWRTLTRVIVPMTLPGLIAGAVFVFASAVTAFVSQSIIGGARVTFLTTILFSRAMITFDWGLASVAALVLLIAAGVPIALALYVGGRAERAIYG